MSILNRRAFGDIAHFDKLSAPTRVMELVDSEKRVSKKQGTEVCHVEGALESTNGDHLPTTTIIQRSRSLETQQENRIGENERTSIASEISQVSQFDAQTDEIVPKLNITNTHQQLNTAIFLNLSSLHLSEHYQSGSTSDRNITSSMDENDTQPPPNNFQQTQLLPLLISPSSDIIPDAVAGSQQEDQQTQQQLTLKAFQVHIPSYKAFIPDENDLKYNCRVCRKRYAPRERYYDHLVKCHNMIMKPLPYWRLEDAPNKFDPNNYCAACQKGYKTTSIYRQHLKQKHNMSFSSVKKAKITSSTVSELLNGATVRYACIPCEKKLVFKRWREMKRHLLKTHNILLEDKEPKVFYDCEEGEEEDEDKDEEDDGYTNLKQQQQEEAHSNHRYLAITPKGLHHQPAPSSASLDSNLDQTSSQNIPNINDPNNYCLDCKKTYKNKIAYLVHLKYGHFMVIGQSRAHQKFETPDIIPDINDPNNYCQTCEKTFSAKQAFQRHLWTKHQINWFDYHYSKVQYRKKKNHFAPAADKGITPTDTSCGPSNELFSCYQDLRKHKWNAHSKEVIPEIAKDDVGDSSNKELVVDFNDPNFYCRPCERKFSKKITFYNHIRYRHRSTDIELDKVLASQKQAKQPKASCSSFATHAPSIEIAGLGSYCHLCAISFTNGATYHTHNEKVHQGQLTSLGKSQDDRIGASFSISKQQAHNKENANPIRGRRRESSLNGDRSDPSCKQSVNVSARNKKFYYEMNVNVFPDINDPNFLCKSCNIKFETQAYFHHHATNIHKMTLPPDIGDSLSCQYCNRSYRCKDQFNEHNERLHALPPPNESKQKASTAIKRKYCDFTQPEKKKNTISTSKSVSAGGIRRNGYKNFAKKEYICNVCQDICTNLVALRKHRAIIHGITAVYDNKREYCNLCQFTYSSKLSYYNHWTKFHEGSKSEEGDDSGSRKRSSLTKKFGNPSSKSAAISISKPKNSGQYTASIPEVIEEEVTSLALSSGDETADYYCRSCKLNYGSLTHYRLHCLKYHD